MTIPSVKARKPGNVSRRTASKEVRRRQLIDATIDSIAKHGISGTTMKTVSGLAGLSLGIVNFHFESKENLFEETLKFLAEEHRDAWRKRTRNAALEPAAQLLAIVDAHFLPSICNRKKLAVWFAFYGEARYRRRYRKIMSNIDSERWTTSHILCNRLATEGGYSDVDSENVAKTLEGLFDGICLNILIYPDEFNRDSGKRQIRAYLATKFPAHFEMPDTIGKPA